MFSCKSPWRLRNSVDSSRWVRERRVLTACAGKPAGGNAMATQPKNPFALVLRRRLFVPLERSTPAEQKRSRLRRKSDVARKFPRARFLFRLNGRLPPGNGRRILPQKTLRAVLLRSLTFFSIWAAKSAGEITEGTQPKWRVVRLVRYDRFSFRSGSRLRRSENAQPTELK